MKAIYRALLLLLLCNGSSYAAESDVDSLDTEQPAQPVDNLLEEIAILKKPKKKKDVIYQWVDENGNTVISDKPHPGALEIPLPKPQTYKPVLKDIPKTITNTQEPFRAVKIYDKTPPKLKILSPLNDGWLENNMGNVEISVAVIPYLRLGQVLVIKLDDAEVSRGSLTSVKIQGIDRGNHRVSVEVEMENTGKVIVKEEINFNARRPTVRR